MKEVFKRLILIVALIVNYCILELFGSKDPVSRKLHATLFLFTINS